MSLYLVDIKFSSPDQSWSQSYLTQPQLRLTALLKEDLDNQFWETYSRILIQYHNDQKLLFRVKSIQNNFVYLTQVWKNEDCFIQYKKEALQGYDLSDLLRKKGLLSEIDTRVITEKEASNLLENLQKFPHILQFVSKELRNEKMSIGDPLKKGTGYLPHPWIKTSEILKKIPHLKLKITPPIEAIKNEIKEQIDQYSQIKLNLKARNELGKDRPWYGRGLIDYCPDSRDLSEYLALKHDQIKFDKLGDPTVYSTELSVLMPETMKFIYSLVSQPRICRILWIPPHSVLPWHSHCQSEIIGFQPYRKLVIQVPIVTNSKTIYRVREKNHDECLSSDLNYKEGEAWIFNSWQFHQVENNGETPRISLYVEASLTDDLFLSHIENAL